MALAGRFGRHFSAAIVLAAIVAGAAALVHRPSQPAPALTLMSLEGKAVALESLRGKVVLVNFWATDCVVCLNEMPAMTETYIKYEPRGFEALFIAMPYDRPDRVLHYARSRELPFIVALDIQGEAARAFGGIRGTPTTFVIDKAGRIVERILGEPDFGRLHGLIERKLEEKI
jgi:peroxiredoxin